MFIAIIAALITFALSLKFIFKFRDDRELAGLLTIFFILFVFLPIIVCLIATGLSILSHDVIKLEFGKPEIKSYQMSEVVDQVYDRIISEQNKSN